MPVPKRRWNPQHETLDQTDPDSSVYIEKQGEQDGLIRRVASGVQSHADDEDSGDIVQYLDIEEAIQRLGVGRFQHGIFLACGLCFAADAMEVLMLSFLAVVLQEEWNLTEGQTDSIISVVFAGALLGTLLLSTLGDIWGRRPVFALTAGLISFFGMATALCTNYTQLLVARFLVGFGVGGLTVPYDALGEMMGSTCRGKNLLSTSFFWTGGSLLVPLFAWTTIGNGGSVDSNSRGSWRLFVVFCAVPCVVSTILGVWLVPESPRFLLSKGKGERALSILRKAAVKNGKEPYGTYPEGTILVDGHACAKHQMQAGKPEGQNCCYLFYSSQRRKISFFLMWQWFGLAFVYYGCIIAVSIVFSEIESTEQSTVADVIPTDASASSATFEFDYSAIMISSSAEAVGLTFAIMVIDCLGRVKTQTLTYFLGGLCVLILGLLDYHVGRGVQVFESSEALSAASKTEDKGLFPEDDLLEKAEHQQVKRRHLIFFAFLARLFIMAATSATWLHTSELLPTEIRTTGHGLANASGRVGGLLSPFIITQSSSLRLIGVVIFAVSIMASLCSYCLPETAGMALGDFVGSSAEDDTESVEELELSESMRRDDSLKNTEGASEPAQVSPPDE